MKKILFILLLTIPFVAFSQDLSESVWDINDEDGDREIICFEKDGTFTYLKVRSESGNEGTSWGDEDETWKIIGDKVIISYNDGFMIRVGTINGKYMEGSLDSENWDDHDRTETWFGKKLE